MERVDPDDEVGALLDPESVHHRVTCRQPGQRSRWWAQAERLVDDLHGERERQYVVNRQCPVAEHADLIGNPVLQLGVVAQRPQRVGQRGRRGVVTGDEEHLEVADHLVAGQRPAGVGIPRGKQDPNQLAIAVRVRLTAGDRLLDSLHGCRPGLHGTGAARAWAATAARTGRIPLLVM